MVRQSIRKGGILLMLTAVRCPPRVVPPVTNALPVTDVCAPVVDLIVNANSLFPILRRITIIGEHSRNACKQSQLAIHMSEQKQPGIAGDFSPIETDPPFDVGKSQEPSANRQPFYSQELS